MFSGSCDTGVPASYEGRVPLFIAARLLSPAHLAGRETTLAAGLAPKPALHFRGLGLPWGQSCQPGSEMTPLVVAPSSGSAVRFLFHQRGKSRATLWRPQWSGVLLARSGTPLPKASCGTALPSSLRTEVRGSSAHGMFPRGGEVPLERSGRRGRSPLQRTFFRRYHCAGVSL